MWLLKCPWPAAVLFFGPAAVEALDDALHCSTLITSCCFEEEWKNFPRNSFPPPHASTSMMILPHQMNFNWAFLLKRKLSYAFWLRGSTSVNKVLVSVPPVTTGEAVLVHGDLPFCMDLSSWEQQLQFGELNAEILQPIWVMRYSLSISTQQNTAQCTVRKLFTWSFCGRTHSARRRTYVNASAMFSRDIVQFPFTESKKWQNSWILFVASSFGSRKSNSLWTSTYSTYIDERIQRTLPVGSWSRPPWGPRRQKIEA